jgi:dihydroxyacetone kinase-like predicted kinase
VEKFRAHADISAELLADSLEHADVLARQAVVRPIEGTILSIARAGAEGARAQLDTLTSTVRGARDQARDALAFTPEQLPVLKQAGVVDAGGAGLLLFFDALCSVVATTQHRWRRRPIPSCSTSTNSPPAYGASDVANLRYEVMYFLDADDSRCTPFARCGPVSAIRSSSSAATGCTTATFTPTKSARPSKRRSTRDAHARSASPT